MTKTTQYINTPIGPIPADWEVKKLGDLTNITAGGTPSTNNPTFWGGNIRWMNSGELNMKFVYEVEGRITEEGLKSSSTKIIPLRCILIGLAGQGKTRGTVAMNMIELCTNQSIASIYPSGSFNEYFLYHNLDSRYNEIRLLSTGDGGRGGLNLTILKSLQIPLPPLPEQQKIAEILSTWDKAIQETSSIIKKLEERNKALAFSLLTGKKRVKGFEGKWDNYKLEHFLEEYSSKPNENSDLPVFTSSKNGLMSQSDYYSGGRISTRENVDYNIIPRDYITYRSRSDDGLFTFNKNTSGYDGLISGYYPVFKVVNGNDNFFLYYLNFFKTKLTKYSSGTSQLVLSFKALKSATFNLPSIEEQNAIATILNTANDELKHYQQKLDVLKTQKKGLMQQLLTGKIRTI